MKARLGELGPVDPAGLPYNAAVLDYIARWRAASGVERGPLLRRVLTHFDGSVDKVGALRLHPNSIGLIYKRLVRAAWNKRLLGEMSEAELDKSMVEKIADELED